MIRAHGLRSFVVILFVAVAGMAATPAAQADPAGARSDLTAITGRGVGKVIVSPTSAGVATFVAQVKVNIHDAASNTTFVVTGLSTRRLMASVQARFPVQSRRCARPPAVRVQWSLNVLARF
jgi:hypothetical protein